jgi:hypothetical protein
LLLPRREPLALREPERDLPRPVLFREPPAAAREALRLDFLAAVRFRAPVAFLEPARLREPAALRDPPRLDVLRRPPREAPRPVLPPSPSIIASSSPALPCPPKSSRWSSRPALMGFCVSFVARAMLWVPPDRAAGRNNRAFGRTKDEG